MNKTLLALIVTVVVVALGWLFPPFRVRSLKEVRAAQTQAQFNAAEFVGRFWVEKLIPATERAADAGQAVAAGPQQAREKFGRTVGVSTSYFLFLRGVGRVVGADADHISLALKPEGDGADIVVPLGLVFGNAVRDGTGLLDSSAYPNAQEFNDISAVLNSIVETNVLPEFQRVATVGMRVRFAGCVEVADEETDWKPLKLVPVVVKAE